MTTRQPAVAGSFYPADAGLLASLVDRLVAAVAVPQDDRLAEAYVVPHAGYRYSGPVAAHAYARLRRHASDIQRIVLIGPAHRAPLTGAAVPAAPSRPGGSPAADLYRAGGHGAGCRDHRRSARRLAGDGAAL